MTQTALQLDYAKTPRWHRRSRFRQLLIGTMLLPVVLAAWKWGPQKRELAKVLYWQYRLMHYSAPPEQIVFDQDPAGRSALLDSGGGYLPQTQYEFRGSPVTAAIRVPEKADQFMYPFGMQVRDQQPVPIVFMHERVAPSGHHYLIILQGTDLFDSRQKIGQLSVEACTFKPGDWRNLPEPRECIYRYRGVWDPPPPKRLRIYAGQVDPNDDSHLTVRYVQDGRERLVDGFVDDFQIGLSTFARVKLIERSVQVTRP